MKSLKKSLAFVVVLAIVLSTVAPVFAATPTDVVGTNYEAAVSQLVTLGVLAGYEDGTFKPEQNITRAEFAKIACYVVGVKDAAALSAGTTKFKDVPATHWASGYINIASEKGLLKGYPDATFKPEANVTYAEAITILVRALGMAPVVEGKGTWPANYLAKASAAGVTADVENLTTTGAALRGVIAQLSWNTLKAETWGEIEYNADGIVYGPTGKSLLKDQYNDYAYKNGDNKYVAKEFKGLRVTGTSVTGLKTNQIKLANEKGSDDLTDLVTSPYTATVTTEIKKSMDLSSLYGKKVDVLFGKDNKVAYIKASSKDVVDGIVPAKDFDDTNDEITIGGKDYKMATSPSIYMNGQTYTFDALVAAIDNSDTHVTAALDSGLVKYLNVSNPDTLGFNYTTHRGDVQFIVKEVKADGQVKDLEGTTVFDLDDLKGNDDYVAVVKDGKPATADDIKAGDVVKYITDGTNYRVVASDVKVTGKVTKIVSAHAGNNGDVRKDFTIDGKKYSMAFDSSVYTTKTADVDDAKTVAEDSAFADFSNKDVTVTLNALGEIVLMSADVKATATLQVGVVTKDMYANGDNYSLKIMTPAGTTTTFTVTGDNFMKYAGSATLTDLTYDEDNDTALSNAAIHKGDLVAYEASADNKIDGEKLFEITGHSVNDGDLQVLFLDTPGSDVSAVKDASEKLTISGTSYYADSNTVFVNSNPGTGANQSLEKIPGWSTIVNDDTVANTSFNFANAGGAYVVLASEDSDMIKTLFLDVDTDHYTSSDFQYGVYVESEVDSDDNYVTLFVDGASKRFVATSDVTGFSKGDLVEFKVTGDGEYNVASDVYRADKSELRDLVDADSVYADAYKVDAYDATNRIVTFKTGTQRYAETATATVKTYTDASGNATTSALAASTKSVTIASDAVVYNVTKGDVTVGSLSDISKGTYMTVDKYSKDDDNYGVVVIFY